MGITVAIRTLNEEHNIHDCLEALQKQELKPAAILVVDNQSTDKTIEIAKRFSNTLPIEIIINNVKGFANGLNLAAENAGSEYIVYISADCKPDKKWLKHLYETAQLKHAHVVQGTEILSPSNEVHDALQRNWPPKTGSKKIRYFNNTNTLYHLPTLKLHLPFKSEIGGEDTLMSIDYRNKKLKAIQSYDAKVRHNKYSNIEDFKRHCRQHAKVCVKLMTMKPFYPRIYLHSYYWSLHDMILFIRYRDRKFLIIGYWRFVATLQGMLLR